MTHYPTGPRTTNTNPANVPGPKALAGMHCLRLTAGLVPVEQLAVLVQDLGLVGLERQRHRLVLVCGVAGPLAEDDRPFAENWD
jgi:hypothetical protein